ncbi:RelE Cytotoxic translational repressor of toxin-antitoxin stability system [Acidimicrobiia bacterium]
MTDDVWTLRIAASAERQLSRLPDRIAAAVVEFLLGPLRENPHRVGHPLQRELAGLWSARRGAYRVVCELDDDERLVDVLRIEHRSDVYRPR